MHPRYINGFNTQPPEGGCIADWLLAGVISKVSTHSHPKVAARDYAQGNISKDVSTHSHPKVAAPYIKKQEKSADWTLYFANWFYDKEFDKYNGHIAVIQID